MRLLDILVDYSNAYGTGWVDCDPDTVAICCGHDDEEAIEALRTCIVSDLPWADPFVFENIIDGICGNPVFPDTLTIPPMEEISAAVHVMGIIKPNSVYSDDIKKYICACAMSAGLVWLPENLLFAAEYLRDTDTGLQVMVKNTIEASGWPVYDYPYTESPHHVQLQKLAAIQQAANEIIQTL